MDVGRSVGDIRGSDQDGQQQTEGAAAQVAVAAGDPLADVEARVLECEDGQGDTGDSKKSGASRIILREQRGGGCGIASRQVNHGQEFGDRSTEPSDTHGVDIVGGEAGDAGGTVVWTVVRRGLQLVGMSEGGHKCVLRADLASDVAKGEHGGLPVAGQGGGTQHHHGHLGADEASRPVLSTAVNAVNTMLVHEAFRLKNPGGCPKIVARDPAMAHPGRLEQVALKATEAEDIRDSRTATLLQRRPDEARTCYVTGAHITAVIMLGGILESVLLTVIEDRDASLLGNTEGFSS
ncbi:hypothetical protein [Streptomyces sp. NPDC091215]|uniref:hypothetical protein n=1 Tax=Streptomyces sp. NPDC091215 TaxID=3155192 RepID=UPI0034469FE9